MISFILLSNDPQIPQETLTIYFEEFFIGVDRECEILLPSSAQTKTMIRARAKESGLILQSSENDDFWIEGKKICGTKKVEIDQHIKIGEAILQLKEYDYSRIQKSLDISKQFKNFAKNKEEYSPILEALKKEVLCAEDFPISPKDY